MKVFVKVFPDSNKEKIEKTKEGYSIYVKEKAENNKANKRITNILAKEFNVNYKKIDIKNPKSKDKIVEIGV
jgi:uncharacterized protein YggU (UPF0235/DUF167 family)